MLVYYVAFLVILALAIAVLALVALAAAAQRGDDRTRLSVRLLAVLAHLNGNAAPPKLLASLMAPAARQPAGASEAEPAAAPATPVPSPAPVTPAPAAPDDRRHLAA